MISVMAHCFLGVSKLFSTWRGEKYETQTVISFSLAALILSACGGKQSDCCKELVGLAVPDSLNPGLAILTEAYTIFELVYDSMYDLNLDGSFTLSPG